MEKLRVILEQTLNTELNQAIISNRRNPERGKKVVLRVFENRGRILFQFAEYRGNQIFHKNCEQKEAVEHTIELLRESYKQIEIMTQNKCYTALVSKKGNATIKTHENTVIKKIVLQQHNRKKQYILPDDEPIPFLVELGVQTEEGKIIDKKYKKFRQINRFLEFVKDVLPELPKDREITILDFGCGK